MIGRVFGTAVVLVAVACSVQAAGLTGELAMLDGWIGNWQVEAEWASGGTVWAQTSYRPLLNGRYLEGRVLVRDNGGEPYQRYRTVFAWDAESGRVVGHTFAADGTYTATPLEVEGAIVTSRWNSGDGTFIDRVELADTDTMRWQVWMVPADGQRQQIMDGTWHRIEQDIDFPTVDRLAPELEMIEPYLGGWEASPDGAAPWARRHQTVGLAGRFMEGRYWAAAGEEGEVSEFAQYVFCAAVEGDMKVVIFSANGEVVSSAVKTAEDVLVQDSADGRQSRVKLVSDELFQMKVLADGVLVSSTAWHRQGAAGRRAVINPERFVASGRELRSFTVDKEIVARPAAVFAAWTEEETWESLWGPQSSSDLELAIGGDYEWKFNGWLGSNGCQVLSYIPDRMLSFSWSSPPGQPRTRLLRTWVVVELEAVEDNRTHVRLTHLGFGEGPEWDETMAYFEKAWVSVLQLMAERLGVAVSS